jgi:Flp pilus assembly protein TadD
MNFRLSKHEIIRPPHLLLFLLLFALSSGCGNKSLSVDDPLSGPSIVREITKTTGHAAGYVAESICADCHGDIVETYQQVSMSKSFYPFDPQQKIEDFDANHFYHVASDRHYEMTVRDGKMYVSRYQIDDQGKRFNEFEVAVDWVIGSGNHVRSYLTQTESGELFQLPISWYKNDGWQMSPGFEIAHGLDFSRQVTRECMFCHNAYPDVPAGADRFGEPEFFPIDLPHGIGCQRCHGPGAEHIRIAEENEATTTELRDSIVNPARLDPALRDDVCMQCHLQPAIEITSLMRRFGRSDYSYQPGEPLSDYLLHLDIADNSHADRFQINHHPYRLHQSACYLNSGKAISCLSCHDPHVKVSQEQRALHYRKACLSCHKSNDCNQELMREVADQQGIASDDCVSCHMGQRVPADVTHVVMTDHWIQKRPRPLSPIDENLRHEPLVNPQLSFYDNERAPQGKLAKVYMAVTLSRSGYPDMQRLQEAVKAEPEISETCFYLGTELLAARKYADAEATFARATQLAPDRSWPHLGLAKVLQRQNRHQTAVEEFDKAREMAPNDPEIQLGLARSYVQLGRPDDAIAALQEAIRLRENYAEAYHELGMIHAQQRKFAPAEYWYKRALAIESTNIRTIRDLGMVLLSQGRFADLVQCWRQGAWVNPENAEIRDWLAQVLLTCPDDSVRDFKLGDQYASEAYALAPQQPSILATRAMAYLLNNQFIDALSITESAENTDGDRTNLQFIRAISLNHLGRFEEARGAYEMAQRLAVSYPSADAMRRVLERLAQQAMH